MSTTIESKGRFPDEKDIEIVDSALRGAHDALEALVWGVTDAADHVGNEPDCRRITMTDIGVVAAIRAELKLRVEEFARMRDRLDGAIFELLAIQSEQARGPGVA